MIDAAPRKKPIANGASQAARRFSSRRSMATILPNSPPRATDSVAPG
jgi:hypothetical protein